MKKGILFIAVVSLALITFGCKPSKEDEEVRNFVKNYVSIMQAVYAEANLNLLVPFTAEKEIKKVFPVIQALKATDNVMKTEILAFELEKSKVKGDTATVRTTERWRFWWQDAKTGAITKPKTEEQYRLEYHLVKTGGGWKVDFVRNRNE
ncbi:nuclear transport factor 2 family protein [Geotalea sp. SG265]|uniref:nuclear transport factor 2 family protein n=1 Tax=Geotalea sp. SG265 TaxID=2922867 RepID=UPI001FAEC8C6|nr:nuclear transport factor 2 family protein [Geotalea sp. SG265]